jgi:hypothetical protein
VLLGKDPKFFFTFAGSVMVLLRDGVDTGSPKKVTSSRMSWEADLIRGKA